ncbi:MAG: ABC transporter substrate-binding protein, partial [Actinobacteria bacterium]|nr:ABC transporter substrate-binding protein [Actinomycetota bacterium]
MRLLAVGAVAVALAAAGCGGSSGGGGGGGSKTLTELDYFEGGNGQAIAWYNKHFEAAHPGWKVKRELVPFANLMPKVLQAASAGDMPNIVFIDNPN